MNNVKINIAGKNQGQIILGNYVIQNSYNKIKDSNIELAKAIEDIAAHLDQTDEGKNKSEEVSDVFKELQDRIANDAKPHMIKMVWNNLVSLVPSINTLTSAALEIKSLFTS
ncbi:MAG: ABC-type Fe3+-hydroxamate transport system substrate-binding protein [Glaciecola sp.]